jgi:anthranilate phosphoribosyltransferase
VTSRAAPFRDLVLLNGAGTLIAAGRAKHLKDRATMEKQSLDVARSARSKHLIAVSNN